MKYNTMDPTFPQNAFGANSALSIDSTPSENSVWDDTSKEDSVVSDCESAVSGADRVVLQQQRRQQHLHGNGVLEQGFVRLGERDVVHDLIKTRFLKDLGVVGTKTEVVAIQRNACSSVVAQARVQCFQVCERALASLRGGNANVKYGWHGTRGEQDIRDIVSHGFGHHHGHKLCISADDSPLESVKRCVADKNGVRHLLLCRVILGRSELVHPCTEQCNPSCEDYDSGVDSFSDPKKYIIWSSRMNTHVLPAYVISFRIPSLKVIEKSEEEPLRPSSPWMPFPTLISVLSKVLPPPDIALISMFHKDHKDKTISRHELIQKVRLIAGDKLLIAAIKSYRAKKKHACKLSAKVKKWQQDN